MEKENVKFDKNNKPGDFYTPEQFKKCRYNFALFQVQKLAQFKEAEIDNPNLIKELSEFDKTIGAKYLKTGMKIAEVARTNYKLSVDDILNLPEIKQVLDEYANEYERIKYDEKIYELYKLLKKQGVKEKDMGMLPLSKEEN